MGLTVSVYRAGNSDCTNNGISSQAAGLTLMNVEGPCKEPTDDYPAAILSTNNVGNPVIKPAMKNDEGEWVAVPGWWMNGGNLAATSDSRFGEAVRKMNPGFYGALYIHDRKEF